MNKNTHFYSALVFSIVLWAVLYLTFPPVTWKVFVPAGMYVIGGFISVRRRVKKQWLFTSALIIGLSVILHVPLIGFTIASVFPLIGVLTVPPNGDDNPLFQWS